MSGRGWPAAALAAALLASGCGGKGESTCGTGAGRLPEGIETIGFHGLDSLGSIRGKGFSVNVFGEVFDLDEEPLREGVRFEIERPARIHGFRVTWANVDPTLGGDAELEAGLYPDFGYNGIDWWGDPLWTGTRCAGDLELGAADYVLETPVEVEQPSLFFVAHEAALPVDATFAFDDDVAGDGTCPAWDSCRSTVNMPDAWESVFFNGTSLQFPYDYMVSLHVEWLDEIPAEEMVFHPASAHVPFGLRMAWGDYDNDGFDDVVTDGPELWRNAGDGTFVVATSAAGIAAAGVVGSGASWGDFDNDGCLDLFVVSDGPYSPNALLRNACDGTGTFTDVTATAGVDGALATDVCANGYLYPQSQAAAWIDLDADGLLDVYVANYNCGFDAPDFVDEVYRNNGDGTFAVVTGSNGFLAAATPSRSASPADADGDGDVDLYVANYFLKPNLFYRNDGGTFAESAEAVDLDGLPTPFQGEDMYGHSLGGAWGDLDGDGDLDLVEANLAHPRFFHFSNKTRVMRNDGTIFTDLSGDWSFPASETGLRYSETHTSPLLADVDHDGNLDLFLSARYDGRPTDFYRGNGDGSFLLDVARSGVTARDGWCLASADADHDGDLDLAARGALFENALANKGHWVQVRAVGNVAANRAAIGATIRVTAGGSTRVRTVAGSSGSGCQDSLVQHVGIGAATSVDAIEVTFPGGTTVSYPGPFAADQRIWVYEDGTTLLGWDAPT